MPHFSIEIADRAGTCYGVQRALDMAKHAGQQASDASPVHTLGPLIHNPIVVEELEKLNVHMAQNLDEIASGTVVVRAHGVIPELIDEAQDKGLAVIDATCPYVKKVHHAAEKLAAEGHRIVVVGEHGHPEVEGILGHAGPDAVVVENADQALQMQISGKVGIVVQTTQTAVNLAQIVSVLVPQCRELRVVNTICSATSERQESASELASRVDAMVVIGGRNSGNTRRLAQICQDRCSRTYHIEQAEELHQEWFKDVRSIGITAGASTPKSHIDTVVSRLKGMDI